MNDRPSSVERRLTAWLDEGPTSGPDDLLASAHARARSARQLPAWWLALRGRTMETTWRARPMPLGRLGLAILTTLLLAALLGAALLAGARLLSSPGPSDGRNAALVIPQGDEALLAFTSWASEEAACDLYVVRADGQDGRHLTSDPLCDVSPTWSPDGGRVAVYSGDESGNQLRVVEPGGSVRKLADAPGCWSSASQAPVWSPDGRFLLYIGDERPDDGSCEPVTTQLYVVASDGTGEPHRLLSSAFTQHSGSVAWQGDQIVFRANEPGGLSGLWLATITDPEQPWDLEATRLETSFADPVSFGWPRWSPDGTEIAVTFIPAGTGFGTTTTFRPDGGVSHLSLTDRGAWRRPGGRADARGGWLARVSHDRLCGAGVTLAGSVPARVAHRRQLPGWKRLCRS